MRWVLGIASTVLMCGCSSAPSAPPEPLEYEQRLDELLRLRPDDPDLLFLRHDHKDLTRCRRLVELRPSPLVLASVVSKHFTAGVDEESLPDLERLLAAWQKVDPENAMPVILQGLIRISRGNLSAGIKTILEATQLPALRLYGLDVQQEVLRIQKQEDLNDAYYFGAVYLEDVRLTNPILGVSRLLRSMATWEFLDGNTEGSVRMAEAEFRLARHFERDARTYMEGMVLSTLAPYSAERMCELALMRQDPQSATRYASIARDAWISDKARSIAEKRYWLADPVQKIMRELAMVDTADEPPEAEDLDALLTRILEATTAWMKIWDKNKDRFHQALNERGDEVREHLEAQIARGYLEAASKQLTQKDRDSLEPLRPPIDRFMELKDVFYPPIYGPAQRRRLVELLTAEGPEEESESREFLQERAAHALIYHKDIDALPLIRGLFNRDGSTFNTMRAVIVMIALGEKMSQVGEGLRETATSADPASCWAVARLRLKELIPDFLTSLYTDTGPSHITFGFAEGVNALFALRRITGQEFGLDAEKWDEWGKKEGYRKD